MSNDDRKGVFIGGICALKLMKEIVISASTFSILAAGAATAQNYPAKAVKIVVGFAAGGATDTFSRTIAQKLTDRLGQPFVMENRTGAGGIIAAEFVAKAPPDGYTLQAADIGANAIAVSLYSKLAFDPVKDLAPVHHTILLPIILLVHPSLPVRTVKDLVALAKARPGQLDYVSAGTGGIAHLAPELFKSMAGIDLLHIPTKGGAQQVIDLMGGHAHLTFTSIPTSLPYVKAGKLRAVAAAGTRRSSLLPEIPTIAESGYPGYSGDSWGGFAAPARTPVEIVNHLNGEINSLVALPDVKVRLAGMGFIVVGGTPAEFGEFIRAETAKWAKVVKQSSARVD